MNISINLYRVSRHVTGCLPNSTVAFDQLEDAIEAARELIDTGEFGRDVPGDLATLASAVADHDLQSAVNGTQRGFSINLDGTLEYVTIDRVTTYPEPGTYILRTTVEGEEWIIADPSTLRHGADWIETARHCAHDAAEIGGPDGSFEILTMLPKGELGTALATHYVREGQVSSRLGTNRSPEMLRTLARRFRDAWTAWELDAATA